MVNKKITLIGLGLIGGSLARAFHEKMGIEDITGVNRSRAAIDLALQDGNICRGFGDLNDYVFDSDIIFICTPVKQTMVYLDRLKGKVKPECIITDVGSTKEEIVAYVDGMNNPPCFIGGHPMAGTEKAGYTAGFSHLFENAYYVLTPCRNTPDDAIQNMVSLVKGIGAIPVIMEAGKHDRITAGISHVPHVIASALVNMVRELDSGDGDMRTLAAGGFRDITRIASSSPEMWENIVSSNKAQIKDLLDYLTRMLEDFKSSLESSETAHVLDFFSAAKEYRDSMSSTTRGLISPSCELIIDVVDKPGIIGEITTLLGKNDINIKNINVTNSREFEQGCLKILFADSESVNIAFDLLTDTGYKVYKNR